MVVEGSGASGASRASAASAAASGLPPFTPTGRAPVEGAGSRLPERIWPLRGRTGVGFPSSAQEIARVSFVPGGDHEREAGPHQVVTMLIVLISAEFTGRIVQRLEPAGSRDCLCPPVRRWTAPLLSHRSKSSSLAFNRRATSSAERTSARPSGLVCDASGSHARPVNLPNASQTCSGSR